MRNIYKLFGGSFILYIHGTNALMINVVVSASLLSFSLIKEVGSVGLPSELTCLRDLVFVNCPILRETITVSICFVLHPKR